MFLTSLIRRHHIQTIIKSRINRLGGPTSHYSGLWHKAQFVSCFSMKKKPFEVLPGWSEDNVANTLVVDKENPDKPENEDNKNPGLPSMDQEIGATLKVKDLKVLHDLRLINTEEDDPEE